MFIFIRNYFFIKPKCFVQFIFTLYKSKTLYYFYYVVTYKCIIFNYVCTNTTNIKLHDKINCIVKWS